MSPKWSLWLGLTSLVVMVLMAMWVSKLNSDNDFLRLQTDTLNRENLSLSQELAANQAALIQREAEKENLANQNAALVAAINEVYANDPDAENWAATYCPDGIVCLLD